MIQAADPKDWYDDVLNSARELMAEVKEDNAETRANRQAGAKPHGEETSRYLVESQQIAERIDRDRRDVEEALKHWVGADRPNHERGDRSCVGASVDGLRLKPDASWSRQP